MSGGERLRRYLERQLELLAAYAELQGKIEQAARAGQADLVAAQAELARRLADECGALARAARQLTGVDGQALVGLEARLEAGRLAALEAGRRARASLSVALQELAAALRDLAARPRTPPSPFARIGQPRMIDLHS